MSRYPENLYDTESGLPTTQNNITHDRVPINLLKAASLDRYNDYHIEQNTNQTAGWANLITVLTTTDSLINSSTGIISFMNNGAFNANTQAWFTQVNQIAMNRLYRRLGFINRLLYKFSAQFPNYVANTQNAPLAGRYPESWNELWDTPQSNRGFQQGAD
jgi:hypothetical protein